MWSGMVSVGLFLCSSMTLNILYALRGVVFQFFQVIQTLFSENTVEGPAVALLAGGRRLTYKVSITNFSNSWDSYHPSIHTFPRRSPRSLLCINFPSSNPSLIHVHRKYMACAKISLKPLLYNVYTSLFIISSGGPIFICLYHTPTPKS